MEATAAQRLNQINKISLKSMIFKQEGLDEYNEQTKEDCKKGWMGWKATLGFC